MFSGLLAAVLLAQSFPAWRVDDVVSGATSCPNVEELEAALASQLQSSPTPRPAPSWRISLSAGVRRPGDEPAGQSELEVTLRDPTERVRLRRAVPQGDGECGDVADAVAFIVERYLRDLDWQGPGGEVAPEVLRPVRSGGKEVPGTLLARPVSPPPPPEGPWRVTIGLGFRQAVALEPQAEVGVERHLGTWRAGLVVSLPLASAHVDIGPGPDSMIAREVVVSSWATRLDLARVWQSGPLQGAVGGNGLLGLDLAHGYGFDSVSRAPRYFVAGGLSAGIGWSISRVVRIAVVGYADALLAVQPYVVNGFFGEERVAEPRRLQAGGLLVLTFSFFS